jgi:hypothetical protein
MGRERNMQAYTRFCLTANIERFTTLLQTRQPDETQEATIRLLLAESLAKPIDMGPGNVPLVHWRFTQPAPNEPIAHAVVLQAARCLSACVAAARLALASQ